MKAQRQAALRELVQNAPHATQEELLERLRKQGFAATQATISRDIRDLRLVKRSGSGYSLPSAPDGQSLFASAALSVAEGGNNVVIRCRSGMAGAAAAVFDGMDLPEVLG